MTGLPWTGLRKAGWFLGQRNNPRFQLLFLNPLDHFPQIFYFYRNFQTMNDQLIKLFLRLSLAAGFLSAVADRLGFWPKAASVWGNWDSFVKYTGQLLFFLPPRLANPAAILATALEVLLGVALLIGFRLRYTALLSALLMLSFAFSMILALGIKAPLDYSVFTGAAAALALSRMKTKFLEF